LPLCVPVSLFKYNILYRFNFYAKN